MAEETIERIKNGEFKRIVVLTGAGVSTNAGIPDYRSAGGFFTELMKAFPEAKNPEDLLTRSFINTHKVCDHQVYLNHIDVFKNAAPTTSHMLCKWLFDKGWLLRVYTQNIDGLHQKAGLPEDMVVEYHGSLVKNNVVFYGDLIPLDVLNQTRMDFHENPFPIDLVLVLGTSLKVAPFSTIINGAPPASTKMLVDSDYNHVVGKRWANLGPKYFFINQDTDTWSNALVNTHSLSSRVNDSIAKLSTALSGCFL